MTPIPWVGMGCAKLGAFWQGRSIREGAAALDVAFDGGMTLLDTADCYARGISERLVGSALKRHSDRDVTVMTKIGLLKTPAALLVARKATPRGTPIAHSNSDHSTRTCFEPAYVRWAVERSLRRLRTSQLDALLLHEPEVADLQRGAFMSEINRLLDLGHIRSWGASVRSPDAAEVAATLPGITWLQLPVNASFPKVPETLSGPQRPSGLKLIALAALGDGELLQSAATVLPEASLPERVAALVTVSAAVDGVDGVLLGMSRPGHVRSNLAALAQAVPTAHLEALQSLATIPDAQ